MVFETALAFLIGFVGRDGGRHGGALSSTRCGQLTPVLRLCVFDRWLDDGVVDPLRQECVIQVSGVVVAWGAVDGDLWCFGCGRGGERI